MKPLSLIAVSYVAINLVVCAAVASTFGLPRRGPPVTVFDPQGRLTETYVLPPDSRLSLWKELNRIPMESQALRLLLGIDLFSRARRPQLIVMGSSVASMSCRPNLLQSAFPEYECSNLALLGTNVTVIEKTMDELLRRLPPDVRAHSVIVLCMNYACFMPDSFRWAPRGAADNAGDGTSGLPTCVEMATRRCALILDPAHPVGRFLPPAAVSLGKERLRTWLRVADEGDAHPGDAIARSAGWTFQMPAARAARLAREATREHVITMLPEMTLEAQAAHVDEWLGAPGQELDPDQCEKFVSMLRGASRAGIHVVLIDPPVPGPVRETGPRFVPFQKRFAELFAPFVTAGDVSAVHLTDALRDECFYDLAHPAPGSMPVWTKLLVENIRRLLSPLHAAESRAAGKPEDDHVQEEQHLQGRQSDQRDRSAGRRSAETVSRRGSATELIRRRSSDRRTSRGMPVPARAWPPKIVAPPRGRRPSRRR